MIKLFKINNNYEGCLFIHIPKTAGCSIENVLNINKFYRIVDFKYKKIINHPCIHWTYNDYKLYLNNNNFENCNYLNNNLSLNQVNININKYDINKLFTFCVIRNPYCRYVSMYLKHYSHLFKTFGLFIHCLLFNINHPRKKFKKINKLSLSEISKDISFILRFEHLNDDLLKLNEILKLEKLDLPHLNKTNSKHKDYLQYFKNNITNNLLNKFNLTFDQDFINFKYQKINK